MSANNTPSLSDLCYFFAGGLRLICLRDNLHWWRMSQKSKLAMNEITYHVGYITCGSAELSIGLQLNRFTSGIQCKLYRSGHPDVSIPMCALLIPIHVNTYLYCQVSQFWNGYPALESNCQEPILGLVGVWIVKPSTHVACGLTFGFYCDSCSHVYNCCITR